MAIYDRPGLGILKTGKFIAFDSTELDDANCQSSKAGFLKSDNAISNKYYVDDPTQS